MILKYTNNGCIGIGSVVIVVIPSCIGVGAVVVVPSYIGVGAVVVVVVPSCVDVGAVVVVVVLLVPFVRVSYFERLWLVVRWCCSVL